MLPKYKWSKKWTYFCNNYINSTVKHTDHTSRSLLLLSGLFCGELHLRTHFGMNFHAVYVTPRHMHADVKSCEPFRLIIVSTEYLDVLKKPSRGSFLLSFTDSTLELEEEQARLDQKSEDLVSSVDAHTACSCAQQPCAAWRSVSRDASRLLSALALTAELRTQPCWPAKPRSSLLHTTLFSSAVIFSSSQ